MQRVFSGFQKFTAGPLIPSEISPLEPGEGTILKTEGEAEE